LKPKRRSRSNANDAGYPVTKTPAQIIAQFDCQYAYLDEVEYSLCCSKPFSAEAGSRISLNYDDRKRGLRRRHGLENKMA